MQIAMSPKQIRSIAEADGRVNAWSGSVRSGKTVSSILRWFMFLASPPEQFGHFVMVGRTRDSLARNVIDVMQNEQLFGKLADEVIYRTGQPFAMIMGRKVWVLGASDSQAEKTLRGLTVAGAYVDEVTVVREDLFKQLLARMSVEDAKMFCTTNPDSPMHWFKVEYLDRIGPGEGQLQDWFHWHFVLDDNPQLSEAYKNSLKAEYTGLWYRRFILGLWVSAEGAVFDMWDPAQYVVPWRELPPMRELISVGVDYGTTNPTAAIMLGMGEDNVLYAVDEWGYAPSSSATRWTDAELSKGLREWLRQPHVPVHPSTRYRMERAPDIVALDPAAASFRVQLSQDGLHTYSADNDVLYGIRALSSIISRGRMKVSDRCVELLTEIPGYSWDPKYTNAGMDAPIKRNDHWVDAWRYACITTEGRWRPHIDSTEIEPVFQEN